MAVDVGVRRVRVLGAGGSGHCCGVLRGAAVGSGLYSSLVLLACGVCYSPPREVASRGGQQRFKVLGVG